MPVYRAIRTSAGPWDDDPNVLAQQIVEVERAPVKTGLLDAAGTPIYRMPGERVIGFRIDRIKV